MNTKREYVINELMVEHFVEWETNEICLEETEETGKSILVFQLTSEANLSIKNVDMKNTQMLFFQNKKTKSMFKRVDHIVFEQLENNMWKLHLIEMKSSVSNEKWTDIKGKFRASYLLAQGIAAMLEMCITETCMYTTYEKVNFSLSETMPTARRLLLGEKLVRPEEEWNGNKFELNFGTGIGFMHIPIQMKRSEQNVLVGKFAY